MTGRGVDQILPHSCPRELYEQYVRSAQDYVALAEQVNGPIPREADYAYVWGDAINLLADVNPDARIINLETAITSNGQPLPKGINYRMHPGNTPLLTAAAIDCCVLANNHVLDWGESGLLDTLHALSAAAIEVAGAGKNLEEATQPAIIPVDATRRVLVFAFGAQDSGVPVSWSATATKPGVAVLADFSDQTVEWITTLTGAARRPGDVVVVSVHWGGNWGYDVAAEHRHFAHALIDREAVDVLYGHSSHHPKSIEVYRQRLILYGCGDLLNDYEGIGGYEQYRDDLALLYLPTIADNGKLQRLEMVPLEIRRFRLNRAAPENREWLRRTLDRECRRYGHRVVSAADQLLLA